MAQFLLLSASGRQLSFSACLTMIEDEAALLADIRFALRGLDPWPPKGSAARP
jgi:hypothetical protein